MAQVLILKAPSAPTFGQSIVFLVALLAFANPGSAQSGFDGDVNIPLDQLLPTSLISSGEHRVTGARRVGANAIVFDIESQADGPQSAESIALALIRIHEARTLAQASNQFAQDNRQQPKEGRGQMRVEGDSVAEILTSPLSTSANVVDQFGTNVKRTIKEFGEFPGPDDGRAASAKSAPGDPVFASYRRSVASQLKLDVYSSNSAVQNLLNTLARARVTGHARAGVTTVSLGRSPEVQIESGRLSERVRQAVLNEEESALFNKADTALREAGINADLSARLIKHEVLTPTHKSALTEYVTFLNDVNGRNALIEAALGVANEVQALAKVRIARMYAYYHQSWTPLRDLIGAGHLALAINTDGALLVALPFDFLAWTPPTQRVFDGLAQFAERKGITSKSLLLSGVITPKAREGLEARGFAVFERFLFAR
ncbi:MAG: hypothetical protein ACI9DC_000699 [Gammaproteobacteria bacterium]|jgi:hypothetical protein